MIVISIITGYLVIMNLIGFAVMGIDKRRAVKRLWRIPESTLFIVALIGGSLGSIIGMYFFHHKTRHFTLVFRIRDAFYSSCADCRSCSSLLFTVSFRIFLRRD